MFSILSDIFFNTDKNPQNDFFISSANIKVSCPKDPKFSVDKNCLAEFFYVRMPFHRVNIVLHLWG